MDGAGGKGFARCDVSCYSVVWCVLCAVRCGGDIRASVGARFLRGGKRKGGRRKG